MYKNGIKIHSIVFLLIFSKKTCKIINKCITFAPSKDVVLQELCLHLYGEFMIYVRNHTMNVKSL